MVTFSALRNKAEAIIKDKLQEDLSALSHEEIARIVH